MEIGGYFGLENLIHNEYYPNLIALNTARNAVAYLIRGKGIRKLYIPSFLCDSVYKVCEREKCQYEFYDVGADFQPIFSKELGESEWLYIVNYYGQVTNEVEWKERYGRIIFDNVQAFFQRPIANIDTIYSCRKFFGVPDGAYLASDSIIEVPEDMSMNRMQHILGRYEVDAHSFYSVYSDNEEQYYDLPIRSMSKLTHNILGAIDYDHVKRKREENYSYLAERLNGQNKITPKTVVGPFAYPFYVSDGMRIKKDLAAKGIYIATLWPDAIEFGGVAKDYSENLLPLPCDQRYSISEMSIMCDELEKNIGKK